MKKHPTLKDLANKLELSVSTVSRALQNHPGISNDTKEKVKKLAEDMGYYPDVLALSLKKKSTRTIGVIVPEIRHYYFSSTIDGIEEVTFKQGYTILVAKSNEDLEREVLNTESFISNRVAGLIVSVSQDTKNGLHLQRAIARGIPLVLFDRIIEDLNVTKVVCDDYDSSYKVVSHLISNGYKNDQPPKFGPHLKLGLFGFAPTPKVVPIIMIEIGLFIPLIPVFS